MPIEKSSSTSSETAAHTFVLTIADKPGAMELIAAAFAQRGVSLATSLGSDGSWDEGAHGKILLTFSATPAKKEVLRRALQRLSRVQSLVEYEADSPALRKTALLRLSSDTERPTLPDDAASWVETIANDPASGETTYLVAGKAPSIDALLETLRASGGLLDVTQTTLAL